MLNLMITMRILCWEDGAESSDQSVSEIGRLSFRVKLVAMWVLHPAVRCELVSLIPHEQRGL
jgi:hypothetical protein